MLDHGPPAPDWSVHRDHNAGHSIKRVWASDPQSKILSESSLYRESHGIVIKTSRMSWYDGTLACLRFSTKPFTMPRWSKNSHVQVLSFLFSFFQYRRANQHNHLIWTVSRTWWRLGKMCCSNYKRFWKRGTSNVVSYDLSQMACMSSPGNYGGTNWVSSLWFTTDKKKK